MDDLTLVAVVAVALFFDFTNGFHDTANSIATSVSTRALSPRAAVLSAAVLNVVGAFVSLEVAATIAKGIVNADVITLDVVMAGLVGAITWNLVTWYLGLPSSSSHALIGGVLGSGIAAAGFDVVKWGGLKEKVLIPSLIAPFAGLFLAAFLMVSITWLIRRRSPGNVNRVFRRLQLVSGGFVAFTHGTNDAQKTMGIIALALVAGGHLSPDVGPAAVGDRERGTRDGCGHVCRRLADHQDARHTDREARPTSGLRGSDGVRLDPLDDRPLRLSRLDDAHHLRLRDGRGGVAQAFRRSLGRRREHRGRLDHDYPVRGGRRCIDGARDAASGGRRNRLRAGGGDRLDGVLGAALADAATRRRACLKRRFGSTCCSISELVCTGSGPSSAGGRSGR